MRKCTRSSAGGLVAIAALLFLSASADALPIEASVGSGPDTALVQIEFLPSGSFLFEVAFTDDGSVTGFDLMTELATSLTAFSIDTVPFGGDVFVVGITYGALSHSGFGSGPEDYWHYWTKEDELDPWAFSAVGASDRFVSDGALDGWRYGNGGAPTPEPGTGLLVGIGLAGIAGNRRMRRRAART